MTKSKGKPLGASGFLRSIQEFPTREIKMKSRNQMDEPKSTYPMIDDAIYCLESISKDADELIRDLNDIRSENESLRDWGQHWKDKYEELYKEYGEKY